MPKPWEYDWSGAGAEPSTLNLPPIVPFFGRQRPPMLGEDGQSTGPAPMAAGGLYATPDIDLAAMTAPGPFPAPAKGRSAMPEAGAAPALLADAVGVPATAAPEPLATEAPTGQPLVPAASDSVDRLAQPPQLFSTSAPSMPQVLPGGARVERQPLLQPAAYDRWSGAVGRAGTSASLAEGDLRPTAVMLAQTAQGPASDTLSSAMLMRGSASGTNARRPAVPHVQPKDPAAGDLRNATPLQKEQLHMVPELHFPLPGGPFAMVNPAVWFDRLERVGERWRPGQVSHAGARGPMQVTPIGAKEAARVLGIKLDIDKWKNDPDYGRMLGQADAASLLQRYGGDVVLATAAYNYGAHKLDRLMKHFGDPRSGKISYEDFAQRFPVDETRQYIKRVVYDNFTEERSKPKESQSRRRTPPPSR